MSCPVDHKNMKTTAEFIDLSKQEQQHQQTTQIPNEQSQQKSSSSTTESQNQAESEKSKVNPLNQMEDIENESLPNQKGKLGKERVSSSIPKGEHTPHHQSDKTDNWVYPSEQMFYNAMKKKGWDPQAQDMSTVVKIHNAVNEQTWQQVLKWERIFHYDCLNPKLLRFQGDADKITLSARFKSLFGYILPFDRHDWYVDRCGKEVHYVVEFYRGQPVEGKPVSIHIDARPAVDSISNFVDRVKMVLQGDNQK